jgi:hypothetical protein
MSNTDLSIHPHAIDEHSWWYEEEKGIRVVIEARDSAGRFYMTVQRLIPWKEIKAAAARLDRAPKRKRAA